MKANYNMLKVLEAVGSTNEKLDLVVDGFETSRLLRPFWMELRIMALCLLDLARQVLDDLNASATPSSTSAQHGFGVLPAFQDAP